jgi:hypothetical protein
MTTTISRKGQEAPYEKRHQSLTIYYEVRLDSSKDQPIVGVRFWKCEEFSNQVEKKLHGCRKAFQDLERLARGLRRRQ